MPEAVLPEKHALSARLLASDSRASDVENTRLRYLYPRIAVCRTMTPDQQDCCTDLWSRVPPRVRAEHVFRMTRLGAEYDLPRVFRRLGFATEVITIIAL